MKSFLFRTIMKYSAYLLDNQKQNKWYLHQCKYHLYFLPSDFLRNHSVTPLGLEPKTHALEGRCSNPTELRSLRFSSCKGNEKTIKHKFIV